MAARQGSLILVYGFGLLIGLGIIAGGVALLWQVPAAWKQLHEIWEPAPGKIVSTRVKERVVKTGKNNYPSTLYTVVLNCTYTVEKRELICQESPAPNQAASDGNLEETREAARAYIPGSDITVYYNPKNIYEARLIQEGPNGLFWVGLLGGPLLILSGIGLGAWCWHDWKIAKQA